MVRHLPPYAALSPKHSNVKPIKKQRSSSTFIKKVLHLRKISPSFIKKVLYVLSETSLRLSTAFGWKLKLSQRIFIDVA